MPDYLRNKVLRLAVERCFEIVGEALRRLDEQDHETAARVTDFRRIIEFLYDKNRLNVAISRAKCLAVVVASPGLMHVNCGTPGEMELVNTVCWVGSGAPDVSRLVKKKTIRGHSGGVPERPRT